MTATADNGVANNRFPVQVEAPVQDKSMPPYARFIHPNKSYEDVKPREPGTTLTIPLRINPTALPPNAISQQLLIC